MTSLKTTNSRVGSLFAVAAFVLATVTPGLVPAFASAAQVTERSVELSSSSKAATGVRYNVNFTTVSTTAPAAVVLEFCNDTPLIGAACTAPAGFDASAATASASGYTLEATTAGGTTAKNSVVVEGTFAAAGSVNIPLTGVANPSNAGALYVRILTYDTVANAKAYTSAAYTTGLLDQGSAAVSITDTVGVSAAVLESMTFCVSGDLITTENCGSVTAPVLKLGEGEEDSDVLALSSTAVSEGSIYSQISTNAASGAVVSLKSGTACGGLKRASATGCDIAAAGADGITAGQAKIGLQVASATNPGTGENSSGTYQAYGTSDDTAYYNDSIFKLNYASNNNTGITSPYGDAVLDTAGAPVNNKNVQLTFGASASNSTPAGLYSTDLSLIATGKF